MDGAVGTGIKVSRRALLVLSAGAPLLVSPFRGTANAADFGDLSYEEFAALARAELKDLLPVSGGVAQDAYVHRAAALLRRMKGLPPQEFNASRPLDIHPVDKPVVFAVVVLRGLPGATLQAHNHPDYSVATMGLAGAVRVLNFEHEGTPPPYTSTERFKLRQTSEHWLGARDVVTLTPERDNIHTFEAGPEGALWVDISTPHPNGTATNFSYLHLYPGSRQRVGDLYEGVWGKD